MMDLVNVVMNEPESPSQFLKGKGLDELLKQIAFYRKHEPQTESEIESLHQVLLCLCELMLSHEDYDHTREDFLDLEGVELVELILRDKSQTLKKTLIKYYLIQALANAMTSPENYEPTTTKICERFIEKLGLRVLFPFFLEPKLLISKGTKKKDVESLVTITEENIIAIILALLKHCQNTEYLQRILVKFAEKKFEKFNRLIELFEKYRQKVELRNRMSDSEDSSEEDDESLDFILYQICYVFLMICYLSQQYETYDPNSGEKFSSRLEKLLSIEKPELKDHVIQQCKDRVEDLPEEAKQEKNSLSFLGNYLEEFCSRFDRKEAVIKAS